VIQGSPLYLINIQYSYEFVVFCCVGPLALPKKDKIDLWRLAVSGLFALQVGPFALIIKNDIEVVHYT
jgi:hypothetical protein